MIFREFQSCVDAVGLFLRALMSEQDVFVERYSHSELLRDGFSRRAALQSEIALEHSNSRADDV